MCKKLLILTHTEKKTRMSKCKILPLKKLMQHGNKDVDDKCVGRYPDFIWMVSHILNLHTPMLLGWNSSHYVCNTSQTVKIFYLSPIDKSPTSYSVVLETIKSSQQLAVECKRTKINVKYDLNIAITALAIRQKSHFLLITYLYLLGTFIP